MEQHIIPGLICFHHDIACWVFNNLNDRAFPIADLVATISVALGAIDPSCLYLEN
jgi:hypothetical protein